MYNFDATSAELLSLYRLGIVDGAQVMPGTFAFPPQVVDASSSFSMIGGTSVPFHLLAGRVQVPAHLRIDCPALGGRGSFLARPADSDPPVAAAVPLDPQRVTMTGRTVQAYLDAIRRYREMPADERLREALALGVDRVDLKGDEAELTESYFGWHQAELLVLSHEPSLGLGDRRKPLRIACYGAGLHDDSAVEAFTFRAQGRDIGRFRDVLLAVQEALYGPLRATSYEPRELLALFLGGDRQGSIHVFDNNPGIAADLQRPEFTFLRSLPALHEFPFMITSVVEDYWWRYIAAGRDVVTREHGLGSTGYPIRSYSFRFRPEEMAKIRVEPLDIATDRVAASDPFDVSVWFEGWYFLPELLIDLAWAKIVANARVGGYIVTDRKPRLGEDLSAMGLEIAGYAEGDVISGLPIRRPILRKVRDVEAVRFLADLGVVESIM
jgi:hypothetical protein